MAPDPFRSGEEPSDDGVGDNEQDNEMLQNLNLHLHNFPISIQFPASISALPHFSSSASTKPDGEGSGGGGGGDGARNLRTDPEFVQHRLLESGVMFENPRTTVGESTMALGGFVQDLERTGCYDTVQVRISRALGEGTSLSSPDSREEDGDGMKNSGQRDGQKQAIPAKLDVVLQEKRWYKLYVGGGIKHDSREGTLRTVESGVPKVQFETSAGLINLRGCTDRTSLSYSVDQTSTPALSLSHDAPLYSLLPRGSALQNAVLLSEGGSGTHATLRASKDTLDYEASRSYKDFQRILSMRVSNVGNVVMPDMAEGEWRSLEWGASWRDLLPRRYPTSPYACDASPDVVSQVGPSLKHSVSYEYKMNGTNCDDRFNPTDGYDVSYSAELAGPPGDVGFAKVQGAAAFHVPVLPDSIDGAALHLSLQSGLVRAFGFGGLCKNVTSIQDRFFVGGPLQLRGFQPAGIGPRADSGGAGAPGGDALGGEIYYTTSLSTSMPFLLNNQLRDSGLRLMGFVNMGTLSGWGVPTSAIIRTTRVAAGAGLYIATPMGRAELTYSIPLRYGPKDVRKSAQFGFGLGIG